METYKSKKTMTTWQEENISLKFRLGEFILFKIKFAAIVSNLHLDKTYLKISDIGVIEQLVNSSLNVALIHLFPIVGNMPFFMINAGYIQYSPRQYTHYYINIEGSFNDYLKNFSPKSRSTLIRKIRKFEKFSNSEIKWREYKHPSEVDEFYSFAREVSKKTYQENLLGCGLPQGEEFIANLKHLSTTDSMRGYILFHNNIPISYLYSPIINGDTILYEFTGYDIDYKDYSPGIVLQYLVLEKLFLERRIKIFDFTEGENQYKYFFSTGHQRCADIYFFKFCLKNLLVVVVHLCLENLSKFIVNILELCQIKSYVKRLIRLRIKTC